MGVNGQPGTARCGRVTGGGRTQAPAAVDAYRAACARRAHAVRTLPSVETPPYDRPGRALSNARLARWVAWNRPEASGAEVNDAVALRPAPGRGGRRRR